MTTETLDDELTPKPFSVTNRLVFSIALPMTLAFLAVPLTGFIDVVVVGQLGDAALLGGLAMANAIFGLVFASFNFLRSATTGLVAQAFGRGDQAEEKAVFWRSAMIALLCGFLIIVMQWPIREAGLTLLDAGGQVQIAASLYFDMRILSAPASLLNFAILGFVLGQGKGRLGLIFQTLLYGLNICLSVLFGLVFEFGLEGVAFATVASEYVIACISLIYMCFKMNVLNGLTREKLFDRAAFRSLLSLNFDILIRSFALTGGFAWFTRMSGQFGDEVLAGNAILLQFLFISGYFLDGFATAAEQLAGRSIGAQHRPAFMKTIWLTLKWGLVLAAGLSVALYVFGPLIIDFATNTDSVRAQSKQYLIWAALLPLTGILAFQMDGIFVGATWSKDMRNMMLLSLAFFIISSLILSQYINNHGLWLTFNGFMLLRGLTLSYLLPHRIKRQFVAG